jgi:hypothetical protein
MSCMVVTPGTQRSERGLRPRNFGGRPRRGAQPPAEENLERRYADLIESLY